MRVFMAVALASFLGAGALPAHATTVPVASRAALAGLGLQQTATFDSLAPGLVCPPQSPYVPDPCSVSGDGIVVTATRPDGTPPIVSQRAELDAVAGVGSPTSNGLMSAFVPQVPGDLTITLSGTLFGIDIYGGSSGIYGPAQATLRLYETGGAWTDFVVTPVPGGAFFGAQSTLGFTQVDLFATPGLTCCANFVIDNVTTQVAAPVPLPASAWLLLSALACGAAVMRRGGFRHVRR